MQGFMTAGFYIALIAVGGVLAAGLVNLARQSPRQASRSNQLMRLRVIAQGVAIAFLVLAGLAAGAIKLGG